MPATNFYSGLPLDRAARLRQDPDLLAGGGEKRALALWRHRHLVESEERPVPVWQSGERARILIEEAEVSVFLGARDGVLHFACDISAREEPQAGWLGEAGGVFADLRALAPLVGRDDGSVMAFARGLVYWHRRARHCGKCGAPTRSVNAGHARACTRAACGERFFPRLDPAVIMLVTHGGRCLLGRQRAWLPGMHSTLAGFVEIGESLEEAVIREVREETGVRVARPEYRHSQPWPFPSSLMLGFRAEALDGALDVDTDELERAAWFTRGELRASPEDETFRLPGRVSIARRLIEEWIAEG